MTTEIDDFDLPPELTSRPREPVPPDQFLYLGRGLTLPEFKTYIESYNFGPIPPDYLIIHHTYKPSTHYDGTSADDWDAGETGLSTEEIYNKRKARLDAIKEYYRTVYGWDRGPHLYIDDRWVWLFTPMAEIGVHARSGNWYEDQAGKLHYSIGIEVLGNYMEIKWPEPIATNVSQAAAILCHTLNIPIRHQLQAGGISMHREYSATSCPGAQITPDYFIPLIEAAHQQVYSPPGIDIHYVLLGQTKDGIVPWYWINALRAYIERFRVTLGFSLEHALLTNERVRSHRVTIIGDVDAPVPVSADAERILRESGVEVERIPGKTSTAIKAEMDKRAQEGRR